MRSSFLIILFILCSGWVWAQPTISLKVNPVLSFNRVLNDSDTTEFKKDGSGFRFGGGINLDFPFGKNYNFTTGVTYMVKRAAFKANNGNESIAEAYNVRYIEVPVLLKLYTDEVSLDTRLYFQLGTLLGFKVGQNQISGNSEFVREFRGFDSSLWFGAGAEKQLGTNTSIFAGLFYQRGLIDVIKKTAPIDDELSIKTALFGLETGIKF